LMVIVCSVCLALSELELLPEDGKQALVFRNTVPVNATFLEHGHCDLVVFLEVAKVIILKIFGVEGKAVDIEDEPTKEEAVQFAWEATAMKGVWVNGRVGGV
jgi:hypothetical protein